MNKKNMYLIKSNVKNDEYNAGDAIVDLNTIKLIIIAKTEGLYTLLLQLPDDDQVLCRFESKEMVINELKNILIASGSDPSLADGYNIRDITNKNKETEKRISAIKNILGMSEKLSD